MTSISSEAENVSTKTKMWDDNSTKWLINEFKTYYDLWKNGTISKKNQMWQQISDALNEKGLECTAGQAENRFKTLQRSYRKTCGMFPAQKSSRRRRIIHPYVQQLTNIFADDSNDNTEDQELVVQDIYNSDENTENNPICDGFVDESTGTIYTIAPELVTIPVKRTLKSEQNNSYALLTNEVEESNDAKDSLEVETDSDNYAPQPNKKVKISRLPQRKINFGNKIVRVNKNNKQVTKKSATSNSVNKSAASSELKTSNSESTTAVKTSVEILTEMKELIKKIEIRRQVRHEQMLHLIKERNQILKRKNEILLKLISER